MAQSLNRANPILVARPASINMLHVHNGWARIPISASQSRMVEISLRARAVSSQSNVAKIVAECSLFE